MRQARLGSFVFWQDAVTFPGTFGRPSMAKLTFLGAAGTVTGSKYLVEAAGRSC